MPTLACDHRRRTGPGIDIAAALALLPAVLAGPAGAGEGTPAFAVQALPALHHAATDYLVNGQAWGDVDRDGCPDLYVTDSGGANTLLANRCDGTFEVSPLAPSVALAEVESGGAVFADFDNDGWTDLYVLNRGPNTLYRNLRGRGFEDVTAAAGVGDPGQGESATWGDYDGDGDLDLYVVNWFYFYDIWSPLNRDGLYRNDGDGTFTDVTFLIDETKAKRPGFAAGFLDYDNDGDDDLYVVNDKHQGNPLWRNDGPGCGGWCFTDVSEAAGAHRPAFAMGLAVGDYDGDLDLDLYFSSIAEAVLLENQTSQGSPTFVERSLAAGVSPLATSWGTVFFDYDNDSQLDLYLATINTEPERSNRLYRNLADGSFDDVSAGCGADDRGMTFGVAQADYDRDGWVDLVIGNHDEGYKLYRNLGLHGTGHRWLRLILEGGGGVNRDALGTRVYAHLDDGRVLMRDLHSGSSLGAGNERALAFGFGHATVDELEVVWPDGTVQIIPRPDLDRTLEVRHPLWHQLLVDGFESGDLGAWSRVEPPAR